MTGTGRTKQLSGFCFPNLPYRVIQYSVKIDFETKLPSRIRRTGYTGDFYFVAQWFPKFGVYEPAGMRYATRGGWNCHQFHANSEFYSNHSVYDVTANTYQLNMLLVQRWNADL